MESPWIGEIRELHTVKIAVMREWDDDSVIIMPFSDVPHPVVPYEMQTDQGCIQVWNARSIFKKTLEGTPLLGHLTEKDCEDAYDVWSAFLFNDQLGERLQSRTKIVGVPGLHHGQRIATIMDVIDFNELNELNEWFEDEDDDE